MSNPILTCRDIFDDYEKYMWQHITNAVKRQEMHQIYLDFSDYPLLSYLFEVRTLFGEMTFLNEDLTVDDVKQRYDTSMMYTSKAWMEGPGRVANDLEIYWKKYREIAEKNERRKKND